MANKNNQSKQYTLAELIALADIPANKQREYYHALWETGKKYLSREDQALLWEHMKPANSGVKAFAGRKWKADHPEDTSAMPVYITEAQDKRKAEKAAAPAKPKASAPKTSKPASKTTQPKAEDKPAAKAKAPTYTETLLAVVSCMERMDKRLESIDKRLASVEKKLGK